MTIGREGRREGGREGRREGGRGDHWNITSAFGVIYSSPLTVSRIHDNIGKKSFNYSAESEISLNVVL